MIRRIVNKNQELLARLRAEFARLGRRTRLDRGVLTVYDEGDKEVEDEARD